MTKNPWEDSSVSSISLLSFSSTFVLAWARHRRMQLAVIRLVKFFVQFLSHDDRVSLGFLDEGADDGENGDSIDVRFVPEVRR